MTNEWLPWTSNKLDDNLVESILRSNPLKEFVKGDIIYWQGKQNNKFYLLLEGRVEISSVNVDGRKRIVSIHEPRCFFGETILDGFPNVLTATCLTAVKAAELDKNDIIHFDKQLLLAIIYSMSWKSRILINVLGDQTFDEVENRVQDLLLGLSDKFGKADENKVVVNLPLTHQLIADIVGSSRVRVSQTLGSMAKKRKLSMNRKYFTLFMD